MKVEQLVSLLTHVNFTSLWGVCLWQPLARVWRSAVAPEGHSRPVWRAGSFGAQLIWPWAATITRWAARSPLLARWEDQIQLGMQILLPRGPSQHTLTLPLSHTKTSIHRKRYARDMHEEAAFKSSHTKWVFGLEHQSLGREREEHKSFGVVSCRNSFPLSPGL